MVRWGAPWCAGGGFLNGNCGGERGALWGNVGNSMCSTILIGRRDGLRKSGKDGRGSWATTSDDFTKNGAEYKANSGSVWHLSRAFHLNRDRPRRNRRIHERSLTWSANRRLRC